FTIKRISKLTEKMRTFSPKLLLLLLLVLRHHAESGSIVKFLPGFEGPLPFELETGYIGIGEEEELQSFYYFIKSEKNPKEDPLLLWISGGPGCSSISALLFENGPVALKLEVYNETLPYLVSTTYSWTKMTNVLFLDQPIGVGFSYKRTPNLDKSSDTIEVLRIYEFLQKWLGEHPEFFSNTFYVGGDSYSGKIVPAIVDKISQENYLCCKPPINLQGYVLGNPITNLESDSNYRIPYAHGMALISDELYESLRRNCKGRYKTVDPSNKKCLKLVEKYNKCTDKIFRELILLPQCDERSPLCWGYHSTS
ncbi:Peptidase S10 serine carboxypeptidase, partial [Arabidopsis suecica]